MGESDVWEGKVGQVGLDWFGLEGSKSNTISKKVCDEGGHRAARAAKNIARGTTDPGY